VLVEKCIYIFFASFNASAIASVIASTIASIYAGNNVSAYASV